jgi:acyl-CoA reductase-like NAD-dependent aldehyde dehydrogenase
LTLWPVRCGSHVLADDAEPDAEAALAVEQSIARGATLSAQFPGRTARILCPERLFSKFTEALLARLATSPDAREPLPAIEPDLAAYVRSAWELGLDEGATPLAGWEDAPATRELGGEASSRSWPCVFTNVESHIRLCRLTRPAPVLRLIRVPSAEVGRALAEQPAWAPGLPATTT